MDDEALEWLLGFDGVSFETRDYIVEFTVRRTAITAERPHGISYALVLRPTGGGDPWLRFDNAHAVERPGGRYVQGPVAYDHWHRDEQDRGRPYAFTTAMQLVDDFWIEVKRVLTRKGLPHDL